MDNFQFNSIFPTKNKITKKVWNQILIWLPGFSSVTSFAILMSSFWIHVKLAMLLTELEICLFSKDRRKFFQYFFSLEQEREPRKMKKREYYFLYLFFSSHFQFLRPPFIFNSFLCTFLAKKTDILQWN